MKYLKYYDGNSYQKRKAKTYFYGPVYETSIKLSSVYNNLYTPFGQPSQDTRLASSYGNNAYYNDYVFTSVGDYEDQYYETLLNRNDSDNFQRILSGLNDYNFVNYSSLNRWILINMFAEFTGSNYIGQLKLKYSNGSILSVNDSIVQGYIQPFVLLNSFSFDTLNAWTNIMNIIDGVSNTETDSRASMNLIVKVKNISKLTGLRFYSNINFSGGGGLKCYNIRSDWDISLQEFEEKWIKSPTKYYNGIFT